MKKVKKYKTARIGKEAALISQRNRVFVDRKKEQNKKACRKWSE